MKKIVLAGAVMIVLVAALRIHSQTEQGATQTDQRGRFQLVFNPEVAQNDQTYLIDTASGSVWWFKSDGGKKTAILVEKTK